MVSGVEKAEAVGKALAASPPDVHEIPAAGVRGEGVTIWFLDHDSASQIAGHRSPSRAGLDGGSGAS